MKKKCIDRRRIVSGGLALAATGLLSKFARAARPEMDRSSDDNQLVHHLIEDGAELLEERKRPARHACSRRPISRKG